jgi:hypothetical protein
MESCSNDSRALWPWITVIVLAIGFNAITLTMVQSGNSLLALNSQSILAIKSNLIEIKTEVGKLSDMAAANQTINVSEINTLHSKIDGLKLDIVSEFSEEYKLDEIRKSEILEAFKDVE